MIYTCHYQSPLGGILLAADETGLVGLWFDGQKYFAAAIQNEETAEAPLPVLDEARRWLDIYFSGREPGFTPALHCKATPFRQAVWQILLTIPYGRTITYGEIAQRLAGQKGLPGMSAQAVGGAVGHNPISIIVPCHRVVGAQGSLTGYAGGVWRKASLLQLEGHDLAKAGLFVPKKGTAL